MTSLWFVTYDGALGDQPRAAPPHRIATRNTEDQEP